MFSQVKDKIVISLALGLLIPSYLPAFSKEIIHPNLDGIYVVATARRLVGKDQQVTRALSNPMIDGAYISLNWNTVEPAKGRFDWSVLDAELAEVVAQHKKASLAIVPGQYTPEWVYEAGAKHFDTIVEPLYAADLGDPVRLPIPWDKTYLACWNEFVRAFGARYQNHPAVSMIKITGISYRTDETSLPFGTYKTLPPDRIKVSPRTGKKVFIPDDLKNWQKAGYSWGRVDEAFETIVHSFKSGFPDMPMGIMTSDHSFPPLSSDGSKGDEAGYALSTRDFFKIGKRILGNKFVGQFNGLTAKQVNAGVADFAETNPTGYQTGMPTHGEPFFIMNGRQKGNEQEIFRKALLEQAIGHHARFIEVFYDDANNPDFESIFVLAHRQLSRAPDIRGK